MKSIFLLALLVLPAIILTFDNGMYFPNPYLLFFKYSKIRGKLELSPSGTEIHLGVGVK